MNGRRIMRTLQLLGAGAIMLQTSGCTSSQFLEFVQTVLLGITAAGGIAIIQNV